MLHLTQYGALDRNNHFMRRHLRVGPPFSITAGQTQPHIMQHNSVIGSMIVPLPSLLPPQYACICPKAQKQQAGCLFLCSGGCISREKQVRPSILSLCLSRMTDYLLFSPTELLHYCRPNTSGKKKKKKKHGVFVFCFFLSVCELLFVCLLV